ncbi:MAG: OmpA family protein [Planctomycetota bacterium]
MRILRRKDRRMLSRLHSFQIIVMFAIVVMVSLGAGCSHNPYLAGPSWQVPQTATVNTVDAQIAELNRRVQLLDDNNRQLHTQLAQSEQQTQVFRDEAELLRTQLADVSQRLQSTTIAARDAEQRVRGMQASSQQRGGASIVPNTNLSQLAARLNTGGMPVLQDGDVIRIVIPSDRLFQQGSAQLLPSASQVLDPIASQLLSVFPRQRIAIEANTDNSTLYGGSVATSHQLTSAQSGAVLELLTRRNGMPIQQLFTVAQGASLPRQSNDTPAGRAANRRVELVIYPETM